MRPENPRAWVLTIAHRKALDHFRARKRRAVPVGDDLPDVPAPPDPEPRDDGVWARVDALPPKQRAAVLLRFAGDLSHREVAAAHGRLGGGRAPQRLRGAAQAATGDDRMTEDRLAPPTFDPADAAAAAARFAATAPADVHYALVDSPVGTLVAAATPRGLAALSYEDHYGGADAVLDWLAARLSPRILEAPARLDDVRRELDEYFEGRRRDFDLPIDWSLASPFGRRVLKATAAIPFGARERPTARWPPRPATRRPHAPPAARSAPTRSRSSCPAIACIGASGRLTGYTGGLHRKVALLELEGVVLPG